MLLSTSVKRLTPSRGPPNGPIGIEGRQAWQPKVGVIENIEELRAKFCLEPLPHGSDLDQAEIHIHKPRTDQSISTEVSEKAVGGQHKGIRIVIAVRSAQDRIATRPGSEVGPGGNRIGLIPGPIKPRLDGQRDSRIRSENAA